MKEKQKKKLFLLAGFICFFGCLGGFGYYRFRPVEKPSEKHTDSLNTKLPPIQEPAKQLTKMEIYLQAERDSLARLELKKQDPYAGMKKGPVTHAAKQDGYSHRIDELMGQLDKTLANTATAFPAKKGSVNAANTESTQLLPPILETPLHYPSNTVNSTDPELQQLSGMLDKLSALQHSSLRSKSSREDSAVFIRGGEEKTIQAVVQDDQIITSGGIIKLRLLQPVLINTETVPKGCFVYGICQISNERLLIQLTNLSFHNKVLPFPMTVYDTDGMEGIYMPGAVARETGKEGADNALQSIQLGTIDAGGVGTQAASAGLQTLKNLFSRKLRTVRVTAKGGHKVFLQKTGLLSQ